MMGVKTSILDFSGLDSGTHKIKKARLVMSIVKGDRPLIAMSSGNYALALSIAAQESRITTYLVISNTLVNKNILKNNYTELIYLESLELNDVPCYRNSISNSLIPDLLGDNLSKACFSHTNCYAENVTNGADLAKSSAAISNYEMKAFYYKPKSREGVNAAKKISKFLMNNPLYSNINLNEYDLIISPTGSGELLYDLARQAPHAFVIGLCPERHPLVSGVDFNYFNSIADKLVTPVAPMRPMISSLNNLKIIGVSEKDINNAHKLSQIVGLSSEASSSIGLCIADEGFRDRHNININTTSALFVNTGIGNYFKIPKSEKF